MTTRAESWTDERLLSQAADEAIARAQELSMMLAGEPLSPRLELGLASIVEGDPRAFAAPTREAPIVPTARSSALGGLWSSRHRTGDGAVEPRYPFKALAVPLLVFGGLLVTAALAGGDGTRGVLALGTVAVGILIILIPLFARRADRPPVNPRDAKTVLDHMAGVILALRPARSRDGDDAGAADGVSGRR